ncbi:hypothetical protein L3X38_005882 [Prunus dulcis]|uniref:F-box family protein with DUF295 n=1 Tax=Prunus dulcis TaxID=3755 RepID=A0AAD4ZRM2_PRUDU|nr:hypothetical protein L3X38_005882 [Prunus dulcis]
MSTDIQFTFSFISALDICLTRFGARVDFVSPRPARIAARVDFVSPRPARIWGSSCLCVTETETCQDLLLELTLCHRDLPGLRLGLTLCHRDLPGFGARVDFVSPRPARITARVDFVSPRPARIADQADYGPLHPASLWLGLTLCHRDLPGELTDIRN